MTPQRITRILLVTTFIAGCSIDRAVAPVQETEVSRVLTTISVTPTLLLFPGMTGPVSLKAYDQRGLAITWTPNDATYSTSNEAVATVNSEGIVTAVGSGSAEITTTLTVNGVTKSAVTLVAAENIPAAGSYALTAVISEFYSPWGEYTCCTFTALMTVTKRDGLLMGKFSQFRLIHADGTVEEWGDGDVSSSNYKGYLMLHLSSPKMFWTGIITVTDQDGFLARSTGWMK